MPTVSILKTPDMLLISIFLPRVTLGRLNHNHDDPERSDNPVDWKLSFAAKPKKTIVSPTNFLISLSP